MTLPVVTGPDLVTIGLLVLLEGLLSADNAMVLAVLVLGLPKADQQKALRYGIFGAFAFRMTFVLLTVWLIRLGWVKLGGAVYLLYLSYHHFFGGGDPSKRHEIPPAKGAFGLSPFWATVVRVEVTDLVFAIDSILVAVAMSPKKWVIITGGILGIVMMRMVIGKLLAVIERYPPLVDGAFVIIAWVGTKLFVEYLFTEGYIRWEIPQVVSLSSIVVIFFVAYAWARYQVRKSSERSRWAEKLRADR